MSVLGRALSAATVLVSLAACALPPIGPVASSTLVAPPSTPEATLPEPPTALLLVPDGPPVEGDIGTFTWDGFASDAPWLPGAGPVRVRQDILLHVRIGARSEVSEWAASYAPLDGRTVTIDAAQDQSNGPTDEIAFPVPVAGRWSFRLEVWFVDRGRVNYYWQIETTEQ